MITFLGRAFSARSASASPSPWRSSRCSSPPSPINTPPRSCQVADGDAATSSSARPPPAASIPPPATTDDSVIAALQQPEPSNAQALQTSIARSNALTTAYERIEPPRRSCSHPLSAALDIAAATTRTATSTPSSAPPSTPTSPSSSSAPTPCIYAPSRPPASAPSSPKRWPPSSPPSCTRKPRRSLVRNLQRDPHLIATFFTADTHFGHAGARSLYRRPFATVPAMDAALIRILERHGPPRRHHLAPRRLRRPPPRPRRAPRHPARHQTPDPRQQRPGRHPSPPGLDHRHPPSSNSPSTAPP